MRGPLFVILLALGACATPTQARSEQAAAVPAATSDGSTVVAKTAVGDITEKQLDAAIPPRPKLAKQLYELRHDALEDLVLQKLVETAAAKQHLTVDAYLHRELDDKTVAPTEAEVRAFFDRELAASGSYRYEEIHEQLAAHLLAERRKQATVVLIERLREEARVELLLVPPRIDVRRSGPSRGPGDAAVTIVEFSDFQCPYCRQQAVTLRRVLEAYPHDVRLVFLDFPLSAHPDARNAAQAAGCAGEQGQFWAMHDLLFTHQDALSPDDLRQYAQKVGVDGAKFDECMKSGRRGRGIDETVRFGEEVGVDGTPALFVNGRPLAGAVSYAELKQTIDEELSSHDHPSTKATRQP
jgi:predicted DsbA family dithiol-disulfide isomerase